MNFHYLTKSDLLPDAILDVKDQRELFTQSRVTPLQKETYCIFTLFINIK